MPEKMQKQKLSEPSGKPEAGQASIRVLAQSEDFAEAAERLAARLGIDCAAGGNNPDNAADPGDSPVLLVGERGLSLCAGDAGLRADFAGMIPRLTQRNLAQELLVRAARLKGDRSSMTVVDATAGFGEDSLLLAAAGFRVKMYECNPYIAELLSDALRRASEDSRLAPVAARMELICGDSIEALRTMAMPPDIVYLDPMFPKRTKSAAVGKKFQLLHLLERPCENEEELFAAALAAAPRRIIIKRPVKGALLAGRKPAYTLSGKAVRYDVIEPASFAGK